VLAQTAVLELYDPDRSQVITRGDRAMGPAAAVIKDVMKSYGIGRRGPAHPHEAVGSPTLG
jgi:hypothetical protein